MVRRLLTVTLSVVLGLLMVETALRCAAAVVPRLLRRGGERVVSDEKVRIFCIGDSNTYGAGLSPTEAYPAQLERLLNASAGEERFEVVNLGVPGSNSAQAVERLPRYIRLYKPHLLIVLIGVNDYWNPAETTVGRGEGAIARLHRLLSGVRIYRLAVLVVDYFRFGAAAGDAANLKTLELREDAGGTADATVHELRYGAATFSFRNPRRTLVLNEVEHEELVAQNLRRIVEIANGAGVPLVLPTYAANLGHYAVVNRAIQRTDGALVVSQTSAAHVAARELGPVVRRDQLFFPDLHPKGPVYSAFARKLCDALVQGRLIPLERCANAPSAAHPSS